VIEEHGYDYEGLAAVQLQAPNGSSVLCRFTELRKLPGTKEKQICL
jgi:hypothetical protein